MSYPICSVPEALSKGVLFWLSYTGCPALAVKGCPYMANHKKKERSPCFLRELGLESCFFQKICK
jgi:hypothetical protein